LGVVLLKRGEFSEAVAALEEAVQLTEGSSAHHSVRQQVRGHLSEAYRRSGQDFKR
jgi:hypothetical protein